MESFSVLFTEVNFVKAAFCIIWNPLYWNVVARWEFRTHNITKMFGSPLLGCYALATTIFLLGLYREQL
jgi:hypothetical protein